MEKDREQLIRNYFDGDLTGEEEQKALHYIADDPELRKMLRFEQAVQEVFRVEAGGVSFEVPDGFTRSVMHRVEQKPPLEAAEEPAAGLDLGWIDWIWKPRQVQWRPAYGLAAVLVLGLLLAWPALIDRQGREIAQTDEPARDMQGDMQTVSADGGQVWLRFVYIDEGADSVSVAGDFSNWDPIPLTRQEINGEEVWTGMVSMNRGEHRYMFVKNGKEWVTDPLAPMQREDGFGNKNAVIYL